MGKCGDNKKPHIDATDPCNPPGPQCNSGSSKAKGPENGPLAWFGKMIQNCYEYAT